MWDKGIRPLDWLAIVPTVPLAVVTLWAASYPIVDTAFWLLRRSGLVARCNRLGCQRRSDHERQQESWAGARSTGRRSRFDSILRFSFLLLAFLGIGSD